MSTAKELLKNGKKQGTQKVSVSDKDLTFFQKVSRIQAGLKSKKDEFNSFGKYNYRTAEGILEALKPYLLTYELHCYTSSKPFYLEGRFYQECTATITDGDKVISITASAQEAAQKKGMDIAQVSGATLSYARKYALSQLLSIDDGEGCYIDAQKEGSDVEDVIKTINSLSTVDDIKKLWGSLLDDYKKDSRILAAFKEKKTSLLTPKSETNV